MKGLFVILSITILCYCTECHLLFMIMLNVIMPSVVLQKIEAPKN